MKKNLQLSFLLCLVCLAFNSYAQVNHITLSIQNAIQTSGNTLTFDLFATSDGDPGSDLRANAFQFGINYDTLIVTAGDSVKASYVAGSSDFIPPLNTFYFPNAISKNHIRIHQS